MDQQLELPGLAMPADREDLTEWMSGPAPMVGWYETRLKASPLITSMRLWRGGPRLPAAEHSGFSRWSYPAEPHPSEARKLYLARTSPSTIDEDLVEWRGLAQPAPTWHYAFKLQEDRFVRQRVRVSARRVRIAGMTFPEV